MTTWSKFSTKISKNPIWLFMIFGLILIGHFFNNILAVVYQCDEYSYLHKSYFAELYLSGKFNDPAWQNGDAYDQAKLMEYIYAIPSQVLYNQSFIELAQSEGNKNNKSYINYSDWAKTYGQPGKNLEISQKLKNVVIFGRYISAFFTVSYILITVLIIFILTESSYFITYLVFIFLVTHPIINIHGRQILADSALNFFLSLGLLVLLKWWKNFFINPRSNRTILLTIFSGIVGGLAASIKINGFLHLISAQIIFLVAGGIILREKSLSRLKIILRSLVFILLQAVLTLGLFYTLHPSIWNNSLSNFQRFFSWRNWITIYYQNYFKEDNIATIFQAIKFIFLRVAGYMPGVGSIGFYYEHRYYALPAAYYIIPSLVLFVFGLLNFYKAIRSKKILIFQAPAFIWSLSLITSIVFYLKLDWTRYYWPLFLPFLIIYASGLQLLVRQIKIFYQKHKISFS